MIYTNYKGEPIRETAKKALEEYRKERRQKI